MIHKIPLISRTISERPTLKKILDNISWLFLDKVVRMGVGLFVTAWIARHLGPDQYGLWNYTIAFTALFSAFSTLGLDRIVVRELLKHPEKTNELLGTAFVLRLVGGFIAFTLSIITAILIGNRDFLTLSLIALSAGGFIFQAFLTIDYFYQAHIMSRYTVWAQNIAFLIMAAVKIGLIYAQAPLLAFAVAGLIEIILGSAFLVGFYIYQSKSPSFSPITSWRFSFPVAKSLLKDSWPLILSGVTLMIQARIDQVMLKNMIGSTEVGYYSAALRLIELFGFIPVILQLSFYPVIQNSKSVSQKLYEVRLLNFYRLNFLLFLVTAIPIFLFSEKIIVGLFGESYQPAGTLLSLMSIRLFFTNMGVARSVYILSENLMRFSFFTMLAGTLVNILLNYILIPEYKSAGAIIATIISFFVTTFLLDAIYKKTKENVVLQLKAILTFYNIKIDRG